MTLTDFPDPDSPTTPRVSPPQGASAEERLGEQPSDFQLERLGDGVVTVSEYEESVRANVDCLRDAGIEVIDEPTWNADSTEITFVYRWTTPGGISEEERSRLDVGFDESAVECWITYEAFVADRWHSQDIPVGNERATMLESLVLCIREANGVIRDSPDYSDVAALIQDEAASLTEPEELDETPTPGPLAQCLEAYPALFIAQS